MDLLQNDFEVQHIDDGGVKNHNAISGEATIRLNDGDVLVDTQLREWEVVKIDTQDPHFIGATKGLVEGYTFVSTVIAWVNRCKQAASEAGDIMNKFYTKADIRRFAGLKTMNQLTSIQTNMKQVMAYGVSALPEKYLKQTLNKHSKNELLDVLKIYFKDQQSEIERLTEPISDIPIYVDEDDLPTEPLLPGNKPKTPAGEVATTVLKDTSQIMSQMTAFPQFPIRGFGDIYDPWRTFQQRKKKRRKHKKIIIRKR